MAAILSLTQYVNHMNIGTQCRGNANVSFRKKQLGSNVTAIYLTTPVALALMVLL